MALQRRLAVAHYTETAAGRLSGNSSMKQIDSGLGVKEPSSGPRRRLNTIYGHARQRWMAESATEAVTAADGSAEMEQSSGINLKILRRSGDP